LTARTVLEHGDEGKGGQAAGLDISTVQSSLWVLLARLAAFLAHGFAFQFDTVGVVHQTVQNAVGDSRVPDQNFAAHPAQPGARRPRLRFGTVGRIVPVKDHATLMCAFARIAGTFPESELHVLGYGVLEEATRTLAETNRRATAQRNLREAVL
jgi:glycosyltransferase involved in cell wall biosynthesis